MCLALGYTVVCKPGLGTTENTLDLDSGQHEGKAEQVNQGRHKFVQVANFNNLKINIEIHPQILALNNVDSDNLLQLPAQTGNLVFLQSGTHNAEIKGGLVADLVPIEVRASQAADDGQIG